MYVCSSVAINNPKKDNNILNCYCQTGNGKRKSIILYIKYCNESRNCKPKNQIQQKKRKNASKLGSIKSGRYL